MNNSVYGKTMEDVGIRLTSSWLQVNRRLRSGDVSLTSHGLPSIIKSLPLYI